MLKHREGFTLIELLIVVVIIGILAAIAIPKFGQTRERAYYTAMKSDLKNLQTQQEIYYGGTNSGYSYTTSEADVSFTSSPGVTLGTIATANNGQYWAVTATHNALGGSEGCSIWVGDSSSQTLPKTPGGAAAGVEGVPTCDQ